MAKFHISEYIGISRTNAGNNPVIGDSIAQIVKEPALAEQAITFTTVEQSSAFNSSTRIIRVSWDTACHILIGPNPTATANSKFMPSAGIEYFEVTGGDKLSVYDGVS
jgi:hypothetical protein